MNLRSGYSRAMGMMTRPFPPPMSTMVPLPNSCHGYRVVIAVCEPVCDSSTQRIMDENRPISFRELMQVGIERHLRVISVTARAMILSSKPGYFSMALGAGPWRGEIEGLADFPRVTSCSEVSE